MACSPPPRHHSRTYVTSSLPVLVPPRALGAVALSAESQELRVLVVPDAPLGCECPREQHVGLGGVVDGDLVELELLVLDELVEDLGEGLAVVVDVELAPLVASGAFSGLVLGSRLRHAGRV